MTIEEILDILPDKIVVEWEEPIYEYENSDWYMFELSKEEKEYTLSYFCWTRDKELISYTGNLNDVVHKMYSWCVANDYCAP